MEAEAAEAGVASGARAEMGHPEVVGTAKEVEGKVTAELATVETDWALPGLVAEAAGRPEIAETEGMEMAVVEQGREDEAKATAEAAGVFPPRSAPPGIQGHPRSSRKPQRHPGN